MPAHLPYLGLTQAHHTETRCQASARRCCQCRPSALLCLFCCLHSACLPSLFRGPFVSTVFLCRTHSYLCDAFQIPRTRAELYMLLTIALKRSLSVRAPHRDYASVLFLIYACGYATVKCGTLTGIHDRLYSTCSLVQARS